MGQPLKIVIISPFQFRLKRGIERFTFSIANQLAKRGFEVIVYAWATKADKVQWGLWETGIKIRKVPDSRYFQSNVAGLFYNFWLRKDKPDICAINFLYHGEQSLPSTFRYLYILNTPASEVPDRYAFIQDRLHRFPFIRFVAVSEMVKREALPFLRDKMISVIFNGVDTSVFVPVLTGRIDKQGKTKIITAAALEERKGIQHMIHLLGNAGKAFRENIQYDIYGEGAYRESLYQLIAQYNLQNYISIHSPVNNLQEILPNYNLFCLMSHGEAMPMAPLEAMACGLPVLCADCPPFDEFITPDVGLLVSPAKTDKIIEFILRLKDDSTASMFASAARKHSFLFNWDIVTDKYEQLLTEYRAA